MGSAIQPCSDCVTSAACGGESCRKASISAASTSLRDVEREVGGVERFGRGLLGLIERGADAARGRRAPTRSSVRRRIVERQRHPAAAEVRAQRIRPGPGAVASRRCASSKRGQSVKNGRTSTRASASSASRCSRLSSTQARDALHAVEAHVARGFRKPRDGRYIGIIGVRARAGISDGSRRHRPARARARDP